MKQLSHLNLILLLIASVLTSCMAPPVRRAAPRYQSKRPSHKSVYNPIRKKIALLKFVNEAPFGKEDLAIHATEEFRKQVNKLRDFTIDSDASSRFGDSKRNICWRRG